VRAWGHSRQNAHSSLGFARKFDKLRVEFILNSLVAEFFTIIGVARRLEKEIPGGVILDQYRNVGIQNSLFYVVQF